LTVAFSESSLDAEFSEGVVIVRMVKVCAISMIVLGTLALGLAFSINPPVKTIDAEWSQERLVILPGAEHSDYPYALLLFDTVRLQLLFHKELENSIPSDGTVWKRVIVVPENEREQQINVEVDPTRKVSTLFIDPTLKSALLSRVAGFPVRARKLTIYVQTEEEAVELRARLGSAHQRYWELKKKQQEAVERGEIKD
jgi:hypothetical protein